MKLNILLKNTRKEHKDRKENIIEPKGPDALLKKLCCDVRNENCLERTCKCCVDKSVQVLESGKDEWVKYEKWRTRTS